MTLTKVREILASSGTQVEVEVARDSSRGDQGQGQGAGTRLTKSESLRIFRAVPSSSSSSSQHGEARVRTSDY